jgi:predicted TIM-barrel fold metal-dependent hydrolase
MNLRTRTWGRELAAHHGDPAVHAVKIYPNYHNYDVGDPEVCELAEALSEAGLPLIVALRVADERLHNPKMPVAGVPIEPVTALARSHPKLSVVCTNAYRNEILRANGPENLYFDIAFAEYYKTLSSLAAHVPVANLLFGSHTPFFVTKAASMKVAWADLPVEERTQIAAATARKLFRLSTVGEGGPS